MTTAYRSLDLVLQERLREYRERYERERDAIDAARRVLAKRIGLALAGGSAAAFGVLMFLDTLGPWRDEATFVLGAGWLAGGMAMALGRAIVLSREASALAAGPVLTGDTHVDLARLDRLDPRGDLRRRASRWEHASAVLPMLGLSLLTPLTIHWALATIQAAYRGGGSPSDFSTWIALSAFLVGFAHVALVVHSLIWASSLRRRPTANLRAGVHKAWIRALGIATFAAFLPGALFVKDVGPSILLPPLIVAATGLAFIPLMYWATVRRLAAERSRLGD
jgi:hypothetical protein